MICCDDFEKRHIKDCYKRATDEGGLIVLPEKGNVMKFKNERICWKDHICSLPI